MRFWMKFVFLVSLFMVPVPSQGQDRPNSGVQESPDLSFENNSSAASQNGTHKPLHSYAPTYPGSEEEDYAVPLKFLAARLLNDVESHKTYGLTEKQLEDFNDAIYVDKKGEPQLKNVKGPSAYEKFLESIFTTHQLELFALDYFAEVVLSPIELISPSNIAIVGVKDIQDDFMLKYFAAQETYAQTILKSRVELIDRLVLLIGKDGRDKFNVYFGDDWRTDYPVVPPRHALLDRDNLTYGDYIVSSGVFDFDEERMKKSQSLHDEMARLVPAVGPSFTMKDVMTKVREKAEQLYSENERLYLIRKANQWNFVKDVRFLTQASVVGRFKVPRDKLLNYRKVVNDWHQEYKSFEYHAARDLIRPLLSNLPKDSQVRVNKAIEHYARLNGI